MRNVEVQRWMVDSREMMDDAPLLQGSGEEKETSRVVKGRVEEKETSRVGGRERCQAEVK